jgi:glycosyltransferase involved in cell wall biosynthesis
MKLSVIMPVYNEEKTVAQVVKSLLKVKDVAEVVIVNDGSTDGTKKQLSRLAHRKLQIFHKDNGGKGSAIRYGLKKVTGDFVLIQDADLEYDPRDIPALLTPIKQKKAQIIYGSRFLGPHTNLLYWHRKGNDFLNMMVNILYNTTLSDMETCYKVIPTKLWRDAKITSNKFDIEPEITCKLLRMGHKIYEVPISYTGRDFSEGKKITWVDGIDALKSIVSLRFARLQ